MRAHLRAMILALLVGCTAVQPTGATTPTTGAASADRAETAGTGASESITMPDVSGLTGEAAKAKLVAAGKVGEVTFNYLGMGGDDCKALGEGKARSSSPGAGQTVSRTTPCSIDLCGMP
jgi:hypothetical protein